MAKKEKVPVSLATMLASGDEFEAAGKKYRVKPLRLKHVDEFNADNLSIGPQIWNLANSELRKKLDKWLRLYVSDEKGEAMTVERVTEDDWDLSDLKGLVRKMLDLSG